VPQQAVISGEITQSDIRHHKDRNKLLRAIGQKGPVKADVSAVQDISQSNHAFLLCTDGFWEYVEESDMERTLAQSANPIEWVNKMSELLQQRVNGKNDNNTAVAIWIKN
jgi:serine/threonine protein phosphatase PrpC